MKLIKSIISVLFSAILILSATTTSSIAIDKLHFVIGGGAGGVFFFKQKTAYEMLRSLVGSEMCIRDRIYCLHVKHDSI